MLSVKIETAMAPVLTVGGKYTNNVNINVIVRILSVLREGGRIKRTNLAGKSGLNYSKCVRYINLLHLLGWLKMIVDHEGCFVTISESGIEIIERLRNNGFILSGSPFTKKENRNISKNNFNSN